MGAKFRQPPFSVAEANIVSKTITANGTYNASSDSADGYDPVTVNVPSKTIVSKTITANGTYNASSDNADGYNPVTVNVSTSPIRYDIGEFYGDGAGSPNTSLQITLSGHVGSTAILIIMHRDTLTVPSNWAFVNKQNNPIIPGESTQYVSIYKKVVESQSESYTIQQASKVRICACSYYFNIDPDIIFDESISLTNSSTNYIYDIQSKSYYRLCVMSNVYSGNSLIISNPRIAINEYSPDTALSNRMISFINQSVSDLQIVMNITPETTAYEMNRVFCYKINVNG